MVLAFRAFVKILFEVFYGTGFIARFAFIPQSVRGFLLGFGGGLYSVPKTLVPTLGFVLHIPFE